MRCLPLGQPPPGLVDRSRYYVWLLAPLSPPARLAGNGYSHRAAGCSDMERDSPAATCRHYVAGEKKRSLSVAGSITGRQDVQPLCGSGWGHIQRRCLLLPVCWTSIARSTKRARRLIFCSRPSAIERRPRRFYARPFVARGCRIKSPSIRVARTRRRSSATTGRTRPRSSSATPNISTTSSK
jgi:hypothetical protein